MATKPEIGTPEWHQWRAKRAAEAMWAKNHARVRTEAIAKLIETAPPLTPQQVERLRALLSPAGSKGAVA